MPIQKGMASHKCMAGKKSTAGQKDMASQRGLLSHQKVETLRRGYQNMRRSSQTQFFVQANLDCVITSSQLTILLTLYQVYQIQTAVQFPYQTVNHKCALFISQKIPPQQSPFPDQLGEIMTVIAVIMQIFGMNLLRCTTLHFIKFHCKGQKTFKNV